MRALLRSTWSVVRSVSIFSRFQFCRYLSSTKGLFRIYSFSNTLILQEKFKWTVFDYVIRIPNSSANRKYMCTMPPIQTVVMSIEKLVKENKVMIFSKSFCPFCQKLKLLFDEKKIEYNVMELDQIDEGSEISAKLFEITGQKTVPNVFINGRHRGGYSDLKALDDNNVLDALLDSVSKFDDNFEYDLIVIGGGSGGLAASKEAARLGQKVAVCDFVKPSPCGTTWGLGGTCVNVGCIPKKLMHQAACLGGLSTKDASSYGWKISTETIQHDWNKMVDAVQNHIKSLNWGYRVALRDKGVTYLNEYASFVDSNSVRTVNRKGKERNITARNFIIATGGRPIYPDIPGAVEYGITSDDIFSLTKHPGKTLFVGASYISLECAGFCHGIGVNSTVMVRSILLRGFDSQMASKVGQHMEEEGIRFIKECVPERLELIKPRSGDEPAEIKVFAKFQDGSHFEEVFNTVVFAIGRSAETKKIGLENVGVMLNPKNGKVISHDGEQSNVPNIYAIGDVLDGGLELTPVAIQAGKLLAARLCGQKGAMKMNYDLVATTVFTPLEYGCVGLSEEVAINQYGEHNVEVYHSNFWPLEWTLAERSSTACYCKLICVKDQDEKVVGLHYLGPHAGEVTQGYAGMLKMGARKVDFDALVGIHPTTAEVFTTLNITKSSGFDVSAKGC